MAKIFTDIEVRNLKKKSKKYYVRKEGGLTIQVMPTGSKTWLYIYASPLDGKRRFLNLGEYPSGAASSACRYPFVSLEDAREKFRAAKKLVQAGKDPAEAEAEAKEERLKALSVEDLIDEYIEKHAKPRKRTWAEDKRILDKDVLTAWGKRKAADIRKRDVVILLEGIVKRGAPGGANNTFKIIRKMFSFAVERDIIQHTPCAGVKMPAPLVRKERYLIEDEIKTFWDALDTCHVSGEIKRALRLILLTGQRPGEVIGMHVNEIDGSWWTIPVERSKNKRAHRVYLTKTALELIGNISGKNYIFPCPRNCEQTEEKKAINQPIASTAIAHVIRRNFKSPVLIEGKPVFDDKGNPVTENKLGVEFFTPHDLRRTAATFMSKIGFLDEVIDAVLNHVKQGIIRTYNLNRYDKEKQAALEAWERKLLSIITGKESNVIPIQRKAASAVNQVPTIG
jgi:integrase